MFEFRSPLRKELAGLISEHGDAASIFEWAITHRDSYLYAYLKKRGAFDSKRAMREYGKMLVQELVIRVRVSVDQGEGMPPASVRPFVSLDSDRHKDGAGWRHLDEVIADEALRTELIQTFLRELGSYLKRYEIIRNMAEVRPIFDAASAARMHLERGGGKGATQPTQQV